MSDTAIRPGPLTCAGCGVTRDNWVFCPELVARDKLEGGPWPGWDWRGEWWVDPVFFWEPRSYCCTKRCYLSRASAASVKP